MENHLKYNPNNSLFSLFYTIEFKMKLPSLCNCFSSLFSCTQSENKKTGHSTNKVSPEKPPSVLDQRVHAFTKKTIKTGSRGQAPKKALRVPDPNELAAQQSLTQKVKRLTHYEMGRRSSNAHEKYKLRFERMHSRKCYKSISELRQESQKIDYSLVYKFISLTLEKLSKAKLIIRDIYDSKIVLNAFMDYLSERLAEDNLDALITVYCIIDQIKLGSGKIPSLQDLKPHFPDDDSDGVNLSGRLRKTVKDMLNNQIILSEEELKQLLIEISKMLEILLELDFKKFIEVVKEKQDIQEHG